MDYKKFSLLIGAAAFAIIPEVAFAAQYNTDTGFDNPAAWMVDPVGSTGWSVSGSKAVASNVNNMNMLMGMNS